MAAKKVGVFLTGTMKLFFSVTGQIGMKFGEKTSIGVLYLNLNRRILKIFP